MDIDRAKYLTPCRATVDRRRSERGDLVVWFKNVLNAENKKDGYPEHEAGYYAKKLQGIRTKDLGSDLYYLKRKCEEALETGFPVGKVFYPWIKRLKGEAWPF